MLCSLTVSSVVLWEIKHFWMYKWFDISYVSSGYNLNFYGNVKSHKHASGSW